MNRTITIDGPAGAGKGTMADLLALDLVERLGLEYAHLDTGLVYRLLAVHLARSGFKPDDIKKSRAACLDDLVQAVPGMDYIRPEARGNLPVQAMSLGGRRVPEKELRDGSISEMSSAISEDPIVRQVANGTIRRYDGPYGLIADGRDAGSVVFPDACLKFYLYADLDECARRRIHQMHERDKTAQLPCFTDVRDGMKRRNDRDSGRRHDPLCVPDGAFYLDTTGLGIGTVRKILFDAARARLSPSAAPVA